MEVDDFKQDRASNINKDLPLGKRLVLRHAPCASSYSHLL